MVALGDVDKLKVHGKRAHDPSQLLHAHGVDPSQQLLVQCRVVVEAQAFAKEPDLFLGPEEVLALLLDQDPAKHPPEEVDVPPQRLVLWLAASPGREVRVPRSYPRPRSAA